MLGALYNLLNPKAKRPEGCICNPNEYRWLTATYSHDCPVHEHHKSSMQDFGAEITHSESDYELDGFLKPRR